ncbi:MAG: MBL fold metallo-hydrolase [Ignavibacteria bacterium]|nr:MBL fold metallo-hydrolase [Ignavibacteria bacterium]
MQVKTFVVNHYEVNSYLYYDEDLKEGIIIDPGFYFDDEKEKIFQYIVDKKLTIKNIINTHGHLDHIVGNSYCKKVFGSSIYLNKNDWFLRDNVLDYAETFGFQLKALPDIDYDLNQNNKFIIGNNEIIILHTPGHSPGSVCLISHKDKFIFSGDLIFKNSIGRTDLPGGSFDIIINSIKNILFKNCGDEYLIFPGHGEKTSVLFEKENNQFLI